MTCLWRTDQSHVVRTFVGISKREHITLGCGLDAYPTSISVTLFKPVFGRPDLHVNPVDLEHLTRTRSLSRCVRSHAQC